MTMVKHYVEFFGPGCILEESWCEEILTRDPRAISLPDSAYGFRFFSRTESIVDGETLLGKRRSYSPRYVAGRHYTLAQAEAEFPDKRILLDNMRGNNWEVVLTRFGNFAVFEKGDVVLPV